MNWLYTSIALLSFSLAGVAGLRSFRLVRLGQHAKGVVCGFHVVLHPHRDTTRPQPESRYPIIEYRTPDGQPRTFVEREWLSLLPHEVGDSVDVIYPRDDPSMARANVITTVWRTPLLFAGLGALCTGAACESLRRKRRYRRAG